MALIVGGTTVTGTQTLQASTLTGTASAINGSNITSLPAPSSANVGTGNSGLGVGAVEDAEGLFFSSNNEIPSSGGTLEYSTSISKTSLWNGK